MLCLVIYCLTGFLLIYFGLCFVGDCCVLLGFRLFSKERKGMGLSGRGGGEDLGEVGGGKSMIRI